MTHERNEEASKTPKDQQRTPPGLFKALDKRFEFQFDAAANQNNTLCRDYFSKDEQDGYIKVIDDKIWMCHGNALKKDWPRETSIYCNPPYSVGQIDAFMRRARAASLLGSTVVFVVPADISTWWWDHCMNAAEWIRIKGRVQHYHEDGTQIKGSPQFGSMVVIFDHEQRMKQGGKLIVTEMPKWK
jgi:phage N-6-adenine-methyltransferase